MDRSIEADAFALAINGILEEIDEGVEREVMPSIRAALRAGVKREKALAPVLTGRYKSGISSKTSKKNRESFGEIGNKVSPGLAHLLEKGHARIGGGRVAPRVHIAPAAKVTFAKFEDELDKRIDGVLM